VVLNIYEKDSKTSLMSKNRGGNQGGGLITGKSLPGENVPFFFLIFESLALVG
jgi:hypothetical protein